MLIERILENVKKDIRLRPCHTNRASSLGHICERKLVFDRTRWQEATLHDVGLQLIFREGHLQEQAVLKDLTEAGWQVIEQQRDYEWKQYQITAHLDGKVVLPDYMLLPPLEIKSMNPYTFKQINTAQDILQSKKHYIRAYAAQMMVYLLLSNSDKGVFIFKDKSSGLLKEIWMELDYQMAEELVKKAERINGYVAAGETPPPIPWDEDICGRCAYAHICLPEAKREAIDLTNDPELEEKLKRRVVLDPLRKEYAELDDEIKDLVKEKPRVLCGDFLLTGKWQERSGKKFWVTKIDQLTVTKGMPDA